MRERLPRYIPIHPGHNYSVTSTSTLGEQLEGNPFTHYNAEEGFIHHRMRVQDQTREELYAALNKQQLRSTKLLSAVSIAPFATRRLFLPSVCLLRYRTDSAIPGMIQLPD